MHPILRPAVGRISVLLLAIFGCLLGSASLRAQSLELELVAGGLLAPTGLTQAGDDRLFVLEGPGRIRIVRNGTLEPAPFLDLTSRVLSGGERGLLGLAFHPQYASNGRFFVNYTRQPDGATVIARFLRSAADPQRADPGSEAVLLVVPQPFANHNGGQLQFGPDGKLWVAFGDGGSANDPLCNAQRSDTLLGKLLRLEVDLGSEVPPFYSIPPDNPFVGSGGLPDEVWALGLRNPWRFSFDRATGDLYIADVGQLSEEEIDFEPSGSLGGRNYGWKLMEGNRCQSPNPPSCPSQLTCFHPSFTAPIVTYPRVGGGGDCSVIGGYVYRGASIPELVGRYVFGDFCSGVLRSARRQGGVWTVEMLAPRLVRLSSFGEDAAGELYLTNIDGGLYRLRSTTPPDPGTVAFAVSMVQVGESGGFVTAEVRRMRGFFGAVSVRVRTVDGTATAGADFVAVESHLEWADGDGGVRTVTVPLRHDVEAEPLETFSLVLDAPSGGVTLAAPTTLTVTIVDDDPRIGTCVASADHVCLVGDRYQVAVEWRTAAGVRGLAQPLLITGNTGAFTFFGPDNVEVVVKVLDACAQFERYWVFAAGLTNVETRLTATDTATGAQRVYETALGQVYPLIVDTDAFATCP
jgi:glucose/arabinose dehydrogenase